MSPTAAREVRLVERAEPLGALEDALARVEPDGGRVVLVRGEAGIGKTELLRQFRSRIAPPTRVLLAGCDALATPRPLGPFFEVARRTLGDLREVLVAGAGAQDVALSVLDELDWHATTVLVLEDLHWADEATLDVVRLLVRRVADVRALLVLSFRDEEVDRAGPLRMLLGELPRTAIAADLTLAPLSRAAVAGLVGDTGVDPDTLHERTGGNPFFVTEALAARTPDLPMSVRDAVLARSARLPASVRSLLDAASVVPQPVELWLLDALAPDAAGELGAAIASGMFQAIGSAVAFRHELARLAVLGSLSPDVRQRLNRRALAALEAPPVGVPDPARLAGHAEASGDTAAVLRHALRAAELATAVDAHREARDQLARALRFADGLPAPDRAALLERFAEAGYLTDMRVEALEAAREAHAIHERSGDTIAAGRNLRILARLLACEQRYAESREANAAAVEALERLPPGAELARAYAGLTANAMLADDITGAEHWGARTIELADRHACVPALVDALNSLGTIELPRSLDGRDKLERSLALAVEHGLPTEAARGHINLAEGFARRREWAEVRGHVERGSVFCRERGLDAWLLCLRILEAEVCLAEGHWDRAASLAQTLLREPAGWARFLPSCTLARIRARRGDPEVWPLLDSALARAADDAALHVQVAATEAAAEALWLEGRHDELLHLTAPVLAHAQERDEPWAIGMLTLWRRRAGVEDGIAIDPVAAPFAASAAADHTRAAKLWRERGAPYEAALALADGDDDVLLRETHATLRGMGARPAAAIIARRLRERGARGVPTGPRARTQANHAGLTPRELEVLGLLAEGLRNADIARRLVLSEKTVGHHVSAILRKLGVTGRAAAGVEAVRRELVGDPRKYG
ncbi:MAG: hypothetical protein QOD61_1014 [Solirubrobacteraceae bacterium]|nr:hypothetical protein [Solirubrobacteraceae bacterium]